MSKESSDALVKAKQSLMAAVATGTLDEIRRALDTYTMLASEVVGEDLTALTSQRLTQLNKNHDYPYYFSSFHLEGIPAGVLLVDVKEPWYHEYLRAMDDAEQLPTHAEKVAREQQFVDDLKARFSSPPPSSSE